MVIDTSALLSVLIPETDALVFAEFMNSAEERVLSAVSYVEAAMVLGRTDARLTPERLREFFAKTSIRVEPFAVSHATRALEAFARFGKGRDPAKLNFGDCMVYGLAKSLGEPILCKGNDFRQTDIQYLP